MQDRDATPAQGHWGPIFLAFTKSLREALIAVGLSVPQRMYWIHASPAKSGGQTAHKRDARSTVKRCKEGKMLRSTPTTLDQAQTLPWGIYMSGAC